MSALSQQLLLASLFCIFHSLSICHVSHCGSTQLKEVSITVKASFAMNNKWAFLPSHLLSGSHAWIKLWDQPLWPSADPQSLLLATTLLLLLVWSWSHLQHGQWKDPQGTSLLRNGVLVSRPQGNLHLHLQDFYKCDWPWALIWIWKECASQ